MWSGKLSKNVSKATACINMPKWASCSLSRTLQRHKTQNSHSSVRKYDIEVFSKQRSEWWNLEGQLVLLHNFNALRVPFIRDGLLDSSSEQRKLLPLKDMKILDVGCGGGILSEGLARLGATVTAIDPGEELIQVADEHKNIDPTIADYKPTYINTTVEEHVKKFVSYYDGVVASEVMEHLQNKEIFVKACVKAAKPGGKIFVTVPNRNQLSNFLFILFAEKTLKIIPDGVHELKNFVKPTELTTMLEKNNCRVELIRGWYFNPFTMKWNYSRYNHIAYGLQARKLS